LNKQGKHKTCGRNYFDVIVDGSVNNANQILSFRYAKLSGDKPRRRVVLKKILSLKLDIIGQMISIGIGEEKNTQES
jgi:hypothetical protein